MKKILRIVSVMLAFAMALTFMPKAFAAADNSITINGAVAGHTYKAYQLFAGDAHINGEEKILSNVTWGNGLTTTFTTGKNAETELKKITTSAQADQFAKDVVAANALQNAITGTVSGTTCVFSELNSGYYLVIDEATSGSKLVSKYIIKVVGQVETNAKVPGIPGFEKKVDDKNDTTGEELLLKDSADHDIGDEVNFTLTATLPAGYEHYTEYYLEFNDDLSDGFTLKPETIKVTVDGTELQTNQYVVTKGTTDVDDFKVEIENLKAINANLKEGDKVVVTYKAVLNENAVIGSAGNPNTAYLEYSSDPNWTGNGDPTDSTEEDTVIVFTYKVVINKVDEQRNPLAGAVFTLEKKVGNDWVAIESYKITSNDEGTTFSFKGLDDGQYRLKETTTPPGYNTIEDVAFEVVATHELESNAPKLVTLSGNKITGVIELSSNLTDGSLSADVVNNKGTTLPETGGMGTTLFYLVGGALVLGATVVLVTKKRMNN